MIDRLETGMMGLNVGRRLQRGRAVRRLEESGLGREGGAEGIHEYLADEVHAHPRELSMQKGRRDRVAPFA